MPANALTKCRAHVAAKAFLLLILILPAACATYMPPSEIDYSFRQRATVETVEDVQISAVALSAEESLAAFGTNLAAAEIQPIWIEIANGDDQEFILDLLAVDPDYFSPSETAWKTRGFGERGLDEKIKFFNEQHIPVVIPGHTKATGFVYANLDPGAKAFSVELIGERDFLRANFVQRIPGFEADFMRIDFDRLYQPEDIKEVDLEGLRAYVEALPCCVLGGDNETPGDPLNLIVVGRGESVLAVFIRRGWDMTETLRSGTAWRTIMSSIFGSRYRTSPVSPLYLFDRPQDAALQKARATVDERNHLRLWRSPATLGGKPVWVGQISRDIGVTFSSKTLVTHKVDPVVDEARLYIALDLVASGFVEQIGYATGVGPSSPFAPRVNYSNDPYVTDGLRLVVILSDTHVGLDGLDPLEWEQPQARLRPDGGTEP